MFVNAQLTGAPFILNQGLLPEGKYAWRVQIPMNVSYSNGNTRSLIIVALVVRIPTLDNLYGVAIDDMNITEAQGDQVKING
jgi:intracellular multiplication protein IcmL